MLHAPGELADRVVPAFPQAHGLEVAVGLRVGVHAWVEAGEELQVAPGAEALVEAGGFGEQADDFVKALDVLIAAHTGDGGLSPGRGDHAGQHAHGGGLAGPVGAEEAQHLALLDLE